MRASHSEITCSRADLRVQPLLGSNRMGATTRDADYILVRWNGSYWDDLIPVSTFAKRIDDDRFSHLVVKGRRASKAICRLRFDSEFATLDYGRFASVNERNGMEIGELRLTLNSAPEAISVSWKSQGTKKFRPGVAVCMPYRLPRQEAYVSRNKKPRLRTADVQSRKGQGEFRKDMIKIYGGSCAITGCAVLETLEGAHIDTFRENSAHHPQNGILLRCDLHALFDADLLGIDPSTGLIHIADEAQTAPYNTLHKCAHIRLPFGGPTYYPSRGALERRWAAFQARK